MSRNKEAEMANLQKLAMTANSKEADAVNIKELVGKEEIERMNDWQYFMSKRIANPTELLDSFLQQDFVQNEHTKDAWNDSYANLWMKMNPGKTKEDGLMFLTEYRVNQSLSQETTESKHSHLRNVLKMTPYEHQPMIQSALYDLEDINSSKTQMAIQAVEVAEFRKSLEAYEKMEIDVEKSIDAHAQPHLSAWAHGHGDNLEYATLGGSASTPDPSGNRVPAWALGENRNLADEYAIQRYLYPIVKEHYEERMEFSRANLAASQKRATVSMYENIQQLPKDIALNVMIDYAKESEGDNYPNLINGIDAMVKQDINDGKIRSMRDITNSFAIYKEQLTDKLLERVKDHERI